MNSKEIAYVIYPNTKIVFSTKRIALNFVPKGKCTNKCLFCASNLPAIKKMSNHEILLNQEYSINELFKAVSKVYEKNNDCLEIIITGTIGEPLLYFEKLLKLIKKFKQNLPLKIRLNTNGQATIINPKYTSKEICKKLQEAGLDSIVISLNAITEKDYNYLCQPTYQKAFESIIDFIKASNNSRIETFVSFVDYSKTHKDYPQLEKNKIQTFCKKLGLKESQITYRPLIE